MSSAGFTGKTHLLSSERYDNIAEHARNVKNFFGQSQKACGTKRKQRADESIGPYDFAWLCVPGQPRQRAFFARLGKRPPTPAERGPYTSQ